MSGVIASLKTGDVQANKSAKVLEKLTGIKLFDKTTGEVQDMYSVMDQLSEKWGSLTDAEQNAIGNTLAGKTNLNAFQALMSNWDTVKRYVEDYQQGLTIGSAYKEKQYSPYAEKFA